MGGCALRLPTPPHPPKKKKRTVGRELKTSCEVDYCLEVIAEKMLRVCLSLLLEDFSCLVSAWLVMRL